MVEIRNSVGRGGENKRRDVAAVKRRFSELGFNFFPQNGVADQGLMQAIRLFQSILSGRNRVGNVDGRIDVNGKTHRFLGAKNAPRWQTMPLEGPGFINFEAQQTNDHHDFGTSWLADTIVAAGKKYQRDFRRSEDIAAPLAINDVSLPRGGDTPQHSGHETGLACDIRLPRKDGGVGGIGNANRNRNYDRKAMRAQLKALRAQALFLRALFNDRVLIREGLCKHHAGHNNHVHFEVKAPSIGSR